MTVANIRRRLERIQKELKIHELRPHVLRRALHSLRTRGWCPWQVLNKKEGLFTEDDLSRLGAMTSQAAIALQTAQMVENVELKRKQELEFLELVSEITGEIDLNKLLQKVMGEATRMLNAERSTLFLNDEKSKQLWSVVGQGLNAVNIRIPNHLGIAGAVFSTEKTVKIDYVEFVHPETLEVQSVFDEITLLVLAIYVGNTRLIDNTLIRIHSH